MNAIRAIKIAFYPSLGTGIFLGFCFSIILILFFIFVSQEISQAILYALGGVLLIIGLKLFMTAIFGLFAGPYRDALPRGTMLLLVLILYLATAFLVLPVMLSYQTPVNPSTGGGSNGGTSSWLVNLLGTVK